MFGIPFAAAAAKQLTFPLPRRASESIFAGRGSQELPAAAEKQLWTPDFDNISVVKNYSYEDDELLNDESYLLLKSISEKINENSKYLEKISDSHDVVAFYMIMMNHIE